MTVFEVFGPVPDGADAVLAAAAAVVWRQDGRTHVGVSVPTAALVRDAALVGLGVRPSPVEPGDPAPGLVEAHGRDLHPIACEGDTVDRIEIRAIALAEATRGLLRRPFRLVPLSARRRERCRDLLHDRDLAYAATRVVWCPRAAFRDPAYRRSLRPVVFDRGAGAPVLARTARDGDLATWLRG